MTAPLVPPAHVLPRRVFDARLWPPPPPAARHTGVVLRGYAPVAAGEGHLDVRFVAGRLWPAYGWSFTVDGTANVGVGTFDSTNRTSRRELSSMLTDLFPNVELDLDSVSGHPAASVQWRSETDRGVRYCWPETRPAWSTR